MPPSHVKKEEAELRQIAKQSRIARKEAQERERKQRLRAQRAAAAKDGDDAGAAEPTPAKAKQRGAIILPDEVQEMRARLQGDTATTTTTPSPDVKKLTKAEAKKAARAASKRSSSAAAAGGAGSGSGSSTAATSSTSTSSSTLTPAYHAETHFKKKMFFVDVVLHHVPHQKIDISGTTTRQLVVDTSGHTRKYHLVVPFPDGMRCDAAAATYELESGILHCRLPILEGAIPASLEAANAAMVEKMRQQKALRFRVTQDGDLTVRTRQALLAPTPAAQAALLEVKKEAARARHGQDDSADDADSDKGITSAAAQAAPTTAASRKRSRDSADGGKADSGLAAAGAAAAAATPVVAASAKAAKKAKPDVFQAEHAKAMEAAKASAAKVHLSMRERVQLAKAVHASREERLQTRSVRKERKEEQKQLSFQRVIEEQRRQLLARAAMQQPPTPRADAKAAASSKSVRFADA